MYQKITGGGYITGLVKGVYPGNISRAEYDSILAVIASKPAAPEGCDYRLREDLTWELYELPEPVKEDGEMCELPEPVEEALE